MNAHMLCGTSVKSLGTAVEGQTNETKQAEERRLGGAALPGKDAPAGWSPKCGEIPRLVQICRTIAAEAGRPRCSYRAGSA